MKKIFFTFAFLAIIFTDENRAIQSGSCGGDSVAEGIYRSAREALNSLAIDYANKGKSIQQEDNYDAVADFFASLYCPEYEVTSDSSKKLLNERKLLVNGKVTPAIREAFRKCDTVDMKNVLLIEM